MRPRNESVWTESVCKRDSLQEESLVRRGIGLPTVGFEGISKGISNGGLSLAVYYMYC
jgi:hypothetical protein